MELQILEEESTGKGRKETVGLPFWTSTYRNSIRDKHGHGGADAVASLPHSFLLSFIQATILTEASNSRPSSEY